ncbi:MULTISPECIES: recombinase family protein [Streptomyces]|uniref:Recombinase family protein n=1 Tax=Streptomyces tricolor TaxID=68277 RepID=A0ABS9JKJ9_9ACTN|nr:recombinase family protein [Streptomyces tricolor]MCG0066090.1 recombinase family protein [Streptomyces tricolor]
MSHGSTLLPSSIQTVARAVNARTLRAVDYLRVSTEDQKKGYGVARQSRKTTRHIALKQWQHVGTYKDEGVSGSLEAADRGDLRRLMADSQKSPRPFDIVVVPDGRVIGRKGRAFWRWVWALEDTGVYVAVVADDYDNTTSEGRKKMRRDADYAETEWETIRDRTQGGLQEKAELTPAAHIGGRPPYGYRIADKGTPGSYLVVDDAEAKVIRYVFELVVDEGLNLRKATMRLNAEKITTRSGRAWTRDNLRDRVMSSPVLDGVMVFRGKHAKTDDDGNSVWGDSVAIELPRILTAEESTELRRKIAETAKHSSGQRAFYPLTGRVFSLCGKSYTGISRASERYGARYYRCSGNTPRNLEQKPCGCSYIDADALEGHVWQKVMEIASDSEKLQEPAAEWVGMAEGNKSALVDRIADLDQQIEGMNASITAVIVATAKQSKSAAAIEAATAALSEELEQLQHLHAEAAEWLMEMEESDQYAQDLRALARMARKSFPDMSPQQQAAILSLLELKVTITGPVPDARRGGVPCTVRAWYTAAGLDVPAASLSDDAWARVAPLLPKGRKGTVRRSVDAIFYKARAGKSWPDAIKETGATRQASRHFNAWLSDGTWDRVNAALADAERVPLPEPELLPPMIIEGRVDPSAMLHPEGRSRKGCR